MCGIVGYCGKEKKISFLIDTLKRLEYRGYDSCGIALLDDGKPFIEKAKGKIINLSGKLDTTYPFSIGIAHTRWATHGVPSHTNSHPHFDSKKNIFAVHNGIIENYVELQDKLIKNGHKFISQTDTETIPHLIAEFNKKHSFKKAFLKAVNVLEGSFAIAVFHKKENKLYFARKDSPLVLGIVKGGVIIASDIPAIIPYTNQIVNLNEGWAGEIEKGVVKLYNFSGKAIKLKKEKVKMTANQTSKQDYDHYMIKEIFEQPQVMKQIFSRYVKKGKIEFKDLKIRPAFLKKVKKVFVFSCGTAYHAGFVAKYFLEKNCGIDVEIDVSSEARYRHTRLDKNNLVIAISQSGETADTLAAVREAKKQGAKVLGVCNVLGSTLTKESDGLIYTCAGPEIGVASTKAYTAQVFSLFLFCLYFADIRKQIKPAKMKKMLSELKRVPLYQKEVLKKTNEIKKIADKFSQFGCFLFLGRGIHYPSAMEGALKLKEISYIPAEGYPAGEMKHGPIALIDEYRAVVCIALKDELYHKMLSNIQEIKARKGKVLGIVNQCDKEAENLIDETVSIPAVKVDEISSVIVALPLQLFAYFVAKNLGCEIDQPRNLAKSVTVE